MNESGDTRQLVVCCRYFIHEKHCDVCPHQRLHVKHEFINDKRVARHLQECHPHLKRCRCLPLDEQAVRCMRARLLGQEVD